jgi:putative membrane protein
MATSYQNDRYRSRRWYFLPAIIVGMVALAVVLSAAFYGASGPWFGWWFPFGWFIFIPVFFVGFFLIRWLFWGGWWWGRGHYYGWGYDPALEILRERFARGEISREQFDQLRKELQTQ